jgi:HAD superfamily, subfamily IIIB (Acid phosphatase)
MTQDTKASMKFSPFRPLTVLLLGALSFSTSATGAQQLGPPTTCASGKPAGTPLAAQPSAQAIQATADSETSDPTVITAAEPPNFGVARYRLLDYYNCVGSSACYWADIDAQTRRADAALTSLLAAHNATTPDAARAQKLALVLDIDETSLTSYCEEKREDFGYIKATYEAWLVTPDASVAIPGTLRLFRHARAAGVAVFFLTGRTGRGTAVDQTDATARNLAAAGYKDWQGLIMKDAPYVKLDTTTFKSGARARLIAQGYKIILNVGDQWSDLKDPPPDAGAAPLPSARGEISVKLPNPFYYLP